LISLINLEGILYWINESLEFFIMHIPKLV